VASLRASRWAQIIARPKNFIELATAFQRYSPRPNAKVGIPFEKLMRIAITLQNRGELIESEIAREILPNTDLASINAEDLNGLIKAVQNASKFPLTWACAFVEVALRIEGIDLRLLSEFWAAVNRGRNDFVWLRLMHQASWARASTIAAELLNLQDDAALDLASRILSRCPEVSPEISFELNRRATSGLLDSELAVGRRSTLVSCLLHSRPTLGEAKLYSELRTFKTISDSIPHANDQIIARLNGMPQTLAKEQFPSLRLELKRLLSQKNDYPPEICAATLDTLVQLDVVSCPPISEADWRVTS
jgi:hypothetical protein